MSPQPGSSAPSPELIALRGSQDRALEREGIPMVLALVDERGSAAEVTSGSARSGGARLAAALEAFRAELAPTLPDTDLSWVVALVHAVAFADFNSGASA